MSGSIKFFAILKSVNFLYGLQNIRPKDFYIEGNNFTSAFEAEERKRAARYKVLPHIHTEEVLQERRFNAEEESRLNAFKSNQQRECRRLLSGLALHWMHFDQKLCERLSAMQQKIALADYFRRVAAQERRFAFKKKKAENKPIFRSWPMALPLEELRRTHLSGNYVTFGIFLLKSRHSGNYKLDGLWNEQVYPLLEDKLRNWIDDAYLNMMGIENIRFYGDPVINDKMSGESLKDILRFSLDGLPTMLLESSVLPDEVSLSFTVWGLGADSSKDFRRFVFAEKAFDMPPDSDEPSCKAAVRLADWAAVCFKTVIGCSFDAFSLVEYNQMPVFPQLFNNELNGADDSIWGLLVREAERQASNIEHSSKNVLNITVNHNIGEELVYDKDELRRCLIGYYWHLYSFALGPRSDFAVDFIHNKTVNSYALRLCYAERMKEFFPSCRICAVLKDSIDGWCSLRQSCIAVDVHYYRARAFAASGMEPIPLCRFRSFKSEDLLEKALFDKYRLEEYFSHNDKEYIDQLTDLMFETLPLKRERGDNPLLKCSSLYLPFLCGKVRSRLFGEETRISSFGELSGIDGTGELLEAVLAERRGAYCGDCDAIAALVPGSVRRIGVGAFEGCLSLRIVIIAEGVKAIGVRSFSGCRALRYVQIAGTVKAIGAYAFEGCEKLEKTAIPEGVRSIGEYAFYGCKMLEMLFLPDSLEEIGEGALADCYSLQRVSFKGKIYTDCKGFNRALRDMGISGVFHIWSKGADEKLTADEAYRKGAYEGYPVTEAQIPYGVKLIGDYAFSECTALKKVVISGVVSIGLRAFWRCTQLSSVIIELGCSLNWIDRQAFEGCDNLKEIVFKHSVYSDANAFIEDFRYRLHYDSHMLHYSKKSDAFAPNEGKYAAKLALPVSSADSSGFKPSDNEILIEDRTAIDDFAFYRCQGLKSAQLPVSVTAIGGYAFYECTGLSVLRLPVNTAFIGTCAFYDCKSLTDLVLPDNVSFIGCWAFAFCSSLKTVSLSEEITVIEEGVFYGCESLKEVRIPGKAAAIRSYAFSGCDSLESVVLPDGLTEISRSAFKECRRLHRIVFKGKVYSSVKSFYADVKKIIKR